MKDLLLHLFRYYALIDSIVHCTITYDSTCTHHVSYVFITYLIHLIFQVCYILIMFYLSSSIDVLIYSLLSIMYHAL